MTVRWGNGFFRIWLLVAVIWVTAAGYVAITQPTSSLPGNMFADLIPLTPREIIERAVWVFAPPLATFLIGLIVSWIIRGFIPRNSN